MQLIVILVLCFVLILKCSSQGITESDTQYSTEGSSTGTQAIDWDAADFPARTTLQNSERRRYEPNTRATSDYTTLFPNKWGPVMMPMMQPPFGTRIPNAETRERVQDVRDFDPNPRRQKESPVNLTQKVDQYPKPIDASGNQMAAPYIPYSPYMFYPAQNPAEVSEGTRFSIPNNSANDVQPLTLQDLGEKMNISASSPDQFFYRLPNAGFDERFGRIPFPLVRYPPPEFFLRGTPADRIQESFVPFSPYAHPSYGLYPPPPPPAAISNDEGIRNADIFVRSPYTDREPGIENTETKEMPIRYDASDDLNSPDEPPSTPTPVDTVPAESISRPPLPINPFSFGYFPPSIAPPSLFPFHQGEIPHPTLPPRLIPSPPVPSIGPLPSSRLSPFVPPATLADRKPEIVLSPPAAADLPPPAVELPPPEAVSNLPAPVSESSAVPEAVPHQGDIFTGDKELYEFGFDMNDGKGTDQHRQESKDEAGVVTGSYGYRDAFGVYRLVNYIADKNGYRAFIQSNEPGVANPGSADVVVMAERPPPETIAESLKPTQPAPAEVSGDLIVQASETK